MSDRALKYKNYYDKGFWSIKMLWNSVNKLLGITQDEYYQITGKIYPEM